MNVINDAKKATFLLDEDYDNANKVPSKLKRGYFSTNENLSYLSKFNIKDKDVLTICGSGDHVFMSLINGAKRIDSFDSNPLQYYIMELKRAAILGLSRQEYLLFFPLYEGNINEMYNKKYYDKISKYLHKDSKMFWDYVYENSTAKLYLLQLFSTPTIFESDYTQEYDYLKKKLEEDSISFYQEDAYHISKYLNKNTYSLIILSNIFDHIYKCKEYNEKEYLELVHSKFIPLLSKDGLCIYHYQLNIIPVKSFKDYPSIQVKGDTIKALSK